MGMLLGHAVTFLGALCQADLTAELKSSISARRVCSNSQPPLLTLFGSNVGPTTSTYRSSNAWMCEDNCFEKMLTDANSRGSLVCSNRRIASISSIASDQDQDQLSRRRRSPGFA